MRRTYSPRERARTIISLAPHRHSMWSGWICGLSIGNFGNPYTTGDMYAPDCRGVLARSENRRFEE